MINIETSRLWVENQYFEIPLKMIEKKDKRYWKIAPGEGAKFWKRCEKDSNIAVDWSELGDLSVFANDYDQFKAHYLEVYKGDKAKRNIKQLNQLWNFINLSLFNNESFQKLTRFRVQNIV